MVFSGKVLERFVVRNLLVLHNEMHRVTPFAATKAFEYPFGGRNCKRRRFLVVKRTQPQQIDATFTKRHIIADHILNLGGIGYFIYGGLVEHIHLFLLHKTTNYSAINTDRHHF